MPKRVLLSSVFGFFGLIQVRYNTCPGCCLVVPFLPVDRHG
jgi:hypothetical protein